MTFPPPTFAFLDLGSSEILLVMFIILLLFGGDKLPHFAKTIGKAMRELKKASSEVEREFRKAMEETPENPPAGNAGQGVSTGGTDTAAQLTPYPPYPTPTPAETAVPAALPEPYAQADQFEPAKTASVEPPPVPVDAAPAAVASPAVSVEKKEAPESPKG